MEKIAILMSTYNGEKYLSEQIFSIQNQTYKNWHLYVRDDGSVDNTPEIIKQYSQKDSRIELVKSNKNLGPARSFLKLLNDIDADYYFFCDQDDYWIDTKLEVMLNEIKKYDNSIPQLVYCNLKCVNQNLKPVDYDFDNWIGKVSGNNRFIDNDMPGCVMLINKPVKEIVSRHEPNCENIQMHDWWIALVVEFFGEIHFLNQRLVYYRQHGDNARGAGSAKPKSIFYKLFISFLKNKKKWMREVRRDFSQDMEFRKLFGINLPSSTKKLLDEMSECPQKTLIYRLNFLNKYNFNKIVPSDTVKYKLKFSLSINKEAEKYIN